MIPVHREIDELLTVYRDLSEAARHEVDRHVQQCATCARRVAEVQAMGRDLRALPQPRPDDRVRIRFYETIHSREARPSRGPSWAFLRPLVGAAVVMVLVAGLALTFQARNRGNEERGGPPAPGQPVVAPPRATPSVTAPTPTAAPATPLPDAATLPAIPYPAPSTLTAGSVPMAYPLPAAVATATRVPLGSGQVPLALPALAGLVYKASGTLWQIDANGVPVQLFDRGSAVLSPNGAMALYVEGDDIWLAELSTGERRNLTNTPDRVEWRPAWIPGRADIALFLSFPHDPEAAYPTSFVSVVNLTGEGYRVLDEERLHSGFAPSPDGSTIAAGNGWLYRWDGTIEQIEPVQYGITGYEHIGLLSPAWSPNGTRVAWVATIPAAGPYPAVSQLGTVIVDLAARQAALVHVYEEPGRDGGILPPPSWSPDGEWLAYEVLAPPNGRGIWVVPTRRDGAFRIPLPERYMPGASLVWSPDSRGLIFSSPLSVMSTALLLAEVGRWDPQPIDLSPHRQAVAIAWPPSSFPAIAIGHTPTPTGVSQEIDEGPPPPTATEATNDGRGPVPTPVVIDEGDGSVTYVDEHCGLSFRVPATWHVSYGTIHSEPPDPGGRDGLHAGLKIESRCVSIEPGSDPATIVEDRNAQERESSAANYQPTPVIEGPTQTTVNGYLAFVSTISGWGTPVRAYYLFPPEDRRDRYVILIFSPAGFMPDVVEQILATVQLTSALPSTPPAPIPSSTPEQAATSAPSVTHIDWQAMKASHTPSIRTARTSW